MLNDTYVPGCGSINAKIAIVGEAPSYEEIQAKLPFVGPSGKFLNELLHYAGIKRNECWVTNVCKYIVTPNAKQGRKIPFHIRAERDGINIQEQIEDLRRELLQVRPNIIIALGGTALWALTGKNGIEKWRGSKLLGFGIKTIATYHPAHILHQDGESTGYWQKQVLAFDLRRAAKESLTRDLNLPTRLLRVAKSADEVYEYFERNKAMVDPAVDIEAHPSGSGIPVCIGFSYKPSEGFTVPLWNVDGISNIPNSGLASIWIKLAQELAKSQVIGQNFGYDRDKISRLGFKIGGLKSDTMLKAFVINPEFPKNLAFNTSIYTEEPYYKDEGMYEGSIEDLFIGCSRDACVTKEVDIAQDKDLDEAGMRPFYENFIIKLHDLYRHIEDQGLKVDFARRNELIKKYVTLDEEQRYKMYQLTGNHINSGSWQQVHKQLFEEWHLPKRKTNEEDLTQLLNSKWIKNEKQRDFINILLENRRTKKTISGHLTAPTDFDGRMRTSYYICLETGRSSTQQQEPPIRPQVIALDEDGKKKKRSLGTAFQTMTKHGDIGADVREQYIADEGYVFLQADSSQAEARVIFLLAEDYEALELIDTHDYHALTASWFFGGSESDYSKKILGYESPIRFAGKTLRHAGHLGAKGRRASIECNTQARKYKIDIKISEAQADRALKTFHQKQPKIKGVFQAEVIKCIEKNRRLIAPVPYGIDAPKGGERIFCERYGDELFRQAFSYLPQRTVSENTKAAGLRILKINSKENLDIKICGESHDALLFSVPILYKSDCAKIIQCEFQRPIDFSNCSLKRGELVIPCEIEEGTNYYKMSKFKL
jgi:uracil-DNA glycosylase family 4